MMITEFVGLSACLSEVEWEILNINDVYYNQNNKADESINYDRCGAL